MEREKERKRTHSGLKANSSVTQGVERILLLQNVFSCYRMCSLTPGLRRIAALRRALSASSYYRMCSLAIECVLLLRA